MLCRAIPSCLVLGTLFFASCQSKPPPPAEEVAKAPSPIVVEKPKPQADVAAKPKAAVTPFRDEPAARALYKQMIEAMRKPQSLSYVSHYTFEFKGKPAGDCIYRAWLKKPNYFRVEAEALSEKKNGGILIGDGKTLWIYWPKGRFRYGFEDAATYEKTRMTSYMTEPAPPGGHSIGHQTCLLGAGMGMPIIDPSTFFGYTDSLQPYLDGVMGLGTEKVGDEECDKIEVSIMKRQRSWYLWLSRRNHLPCKLKQIVRVSHDIIMNEDWSSVTLDAEMDEAMFAWKPPEGWTEWKLPPIEAGLVKSGEKAPDFDLASTDGKRIKLSDYRGQVVWFYVWRAG